MNLRRNATRNRSCEGKHPHDKAGALRHMGSLRAAGGVGLNVYRCRHCTKPGGPDVWHVGHRPGSQSKR